MPIHKQVGARPPGIARRQSYVDAGIFIVSIVQFSPICNVRDIENIQGRCRGADRDIRFGELELIRVDNTQNGFDIQAAFKLDDIVGAEGCRVDPYSGRAGFTKRNDDYIARFQHDIFQGHGELERPLQRHQHGHAGEHGVAHGLGGIHCLHRKLCYGFGLRDFPGEDRSRGVEASVNVLVRDAQALWQCEVFKYLNFYQPVRRCGLAIESAHVFFRYRRNGVLISDPEPYLALDLIDDHRPNASQVFHQLTGGSPRIVIEPPYGFAVDASGNFIFRRGIPCAIHIFPDHIADCHLINEADTPETIPFIQIENSSVAEYCIETISLIIIPFAVPVDINSLTIGDSTWLRMNARG